MAGGAPDHVRGRWRPGTQASRNFAEACLAERADVRVENAVEGLESLEAGSVGVVFNDLLNGLRDLGRVERCYRGALRALRPGGLLLADNVLAGGDVLGQETREGRSVHRWNELVLDDPSVFGLILPTADFRWPCGKFILPVFDL